MNIFLEIQKLLEPKAKGKVITEDTVLKDLGIDSIDLLSLVVDAEEKIGVQVDAEKLRNVKVIGDVVKLFNDAQ